MQFSLQSKALAAAALTAGFSLCGAALTAAAIQKSSREDGISGATTEKIVITQFSPELIRQGAEEFALSCSQCHADDATGDEGPSLHDLAISNGRIAATIKNGVKGQMPSFAKKYEDQQVAALVGFLRTLH